MFLAIFILLFDVLHVFGRSKDKFKVKKGCTPAELEGYGTHVEETEKCRKWKGYFQKHGETREKNKIRLKKEKNFRNYFLPLKSTEKFTTLS